MEPYVYAVRSSMSIWCALCREWPSTKLTAVVVENADYSDPGSPDHPAVAHRERQPLADNMAQVSVSPVIDNDDGGVD